MFDGAVIILSLAPMVASTVANGPSSPWDAISLIITLRIWRVKRIIDGEWWFSLWLPRITWQAGKKEILKIFKDCLPPLFLLFSFLLHFKTAEQKRVMPPMEESWSQVQGCISCFLWAFRIDLFAFLLGTSHPLSCKVNALTCFLFFANRCHSWFCKIIASSLLFWYLLHPPHFHTASSVLGLSSPGSCL